MEEPPVLPSGVIKTLKYEVNSLPKEETEPQTCTFVETSAVACMK